MGALLRLLAGAIGVAVPGLAPTAIVALAGFLAALVGIGGPAGAVWLHMHGKVNAARLTEKAACEVSIAEGAAASAESLSHLLGTIKAAEDAERPLTPAAEKAACAKSRLCRKDNQPGSRSGKAVIK